MKKIIAITLSVLLIISLLPMAAFAGGTKEEVQAKIAATRDALYGSKEAFAANESLDFLLYLSAGGDADEYADGYFAAIRDAFDAGNMTTADRIALLILVCDFLGEDAENFKLNDQSTVNLYDLMVEKGTEVDSPYNYFYVLLSTDDDNYIEQIGETMKNDYTVGSGYNYWGFSTDNSANFAAIMTCIGNDSELVEDAANIVESAKTDTDYYYFADYGTDANADSTASALFAYAIMQEQEKADAAYDLLKNFELGDGNYFYMDTDKTANAYATRDALRALLAYNGILEEPEEPAEEPEDATPDATPTTTEQAAEPTQSTPATGDSLIACGVAGIAVLALGAALVMRKKEQ